ncbi:hypothetical protein LCGC14_2417030, partial [marine sediment metagenome]
GLECASKCKVFELDDWYTDDKKTLARENRALKAAIKELKIQGEIITLESYLREGINLS